ncbi:MAG: tRNA (N6-threonylcarbamoyladenosine(37)-N6)-methyltransferase TrmO [Lachnospiraceae bacterium]|nr:tRNA (N6-threonylcarbamoyladenosine(37)-N6)-methyltransferase TrmO [Lachnospiraceae bacterium]
MEITPIGHIYNDYTGKFGIPRQSGIAGRMLSRIVFHPPYQVEEAFRELEGFSHIWIIWQFSENLEKGWSPMVRPPKLGGNRKVGVFASRSPFRPNALGLSSVKLEQILHTEKEGTVLLVSGADLMNGTPVYDIKPYLAYSDSHPEASTGYLPPDNPLEVVFDVDLPAALTREKAEVLVSVLAADPRPIYQVDEDRIYGMNFGKWNVKFRGSKQVIHVISFEEQEGEEA